jgi:hypothetical protein
MLIKIEMMIRIISPPLELRFTKKPHLFSEMGFHVSAHVCFSNAGKGKNAFKFPILHR